MSTDIELHDQMGEAQCDLDDKAGEVYHILEYLTVPNPSDDEIYEAEHMLKNLIAAAKNAARIADRIRESKGDTERQQPND